MVSRLLLLLLLVVMITPAARGATSAEVEASLEKARKYVWSQYKNGHWEEVPTRDPKANAQSHNNGQYTGRTAMALLALLNSGESNQDPRVREAVQFLIKTPTTGVYALGLRCQLWLVLPRTPQIEQAMRADARLLRSTVKTDARARGMYDYTPGSDNDYSHSRAQYAVLGMWAAAQMGLEVPDDYWKLIEEAWLRNQDKSGGWTYKHPDDTKHPVTPGMTTVGVASLFITEEMLRGNAGISCRETQPNTGIDRGIAWLTKNIDKFPNLKDADWGNRAYPMPTMYAYERVGAASGLRYFGKVDWYETGADWVIKSQTANGSWGGSFGPMTNTCFAMLFLAKGRAPLVLSKLQYVDAETKKQGQWDQRPRDVANIVKWTGRLIERELAWQIVNLDVDLADIIESPIMVISGSEALNLSEPHRAKLKAFIEAGGLVLANADCSNSAFTNSVRKLATQMFPDYEFGQMPEEHPLLTDYNPRRLWKSKPRIDMLSNGVRPLIILIPDADFNRSWQTQDSRGRSEAFEFAGNLIQFAVDRQGLRYRGERFYLPDDPKAKPKSSITVARLNYGSMSDPEPGGWRRMNNVMTQRQSTGVTTKTIELGKEPIPASIKVAHLTGAFEFKLTDAQREALVKYVDAGGTLVIDAAGGRGEFAAAVEAELAKLWPQNKPDVLPSGHAMFGDKPEPVAYRTFARNKLGRVNTPLIKGVQVNNRLAVIYSAEDLSGGLVGQQVDGIVGYTPDSATNLMINILNFATGTKPATQPATKPAANKPAATKPAATKK